MPTLLRLLATSALVVALSGCGDREAANPVHEALCDAADAAEQGQAKRARQLFFDDSHDALHELAAKAESRDRAAAADLLEATEKVESGLSNPDASAHLSEAMRALAGEVRRTLTAIGEEAPGRCPR